MSTETEDQEEHRHGASARSLKDVFVQDDFSLGRLSLFQVPLLRRHKPKWWHWGIAALAAFYVPPAVAAQCAGTLWPPDGYLSFIHDRPHPRTYYYGTDVYFALVALVGAFFGASLFAAALDRFSVVAFSLVQEDLVTAPERDIRRELRRIKDTYRHPVVQFGLIALSVFVTYSIYGVMRSPGTDWWGSIQRGSSWLPLLLATWLMVYFGASAIAALAIATRGLARLFRYPVSLQPLHSDECNGFGFFGRYLVLLFWCAAAIAAVVWIAVGSGYLQLETLPALWLTSAAVILAIPVFLIWPLLACTRRIGDARAARVAPLEAALGAALVAFEAEAVRRGRQIGELSDALQRFASARDAITRVFPTNPFPFKPRLIGTLSAGYVVQFALFVKKVVEALR
jgi:hypothetical protein